ncbi:MAG TPA: group III truncated hemoglobin [Saprospiraceae bacterium]
MKKDITSSEDIKTLVDSFYEKVKADEVIGFIFNDVAQVDWPKHLPRMYAFWEFLLLGKDTYQGNPMEVHRKLHSIIPLTEAHFTRWLQLFHKTVDENFEGLVAEDAKNRSSLIVMTWKPKFA